MHEHGEAAWRGGGTAPKFQAGFGEEAVAMPASKASEAPAGPSAAVPRADLDQQIVRLHLRHVQAPVPVWP